MRKGNIPCLFIQLEVAGVHSIFTDNVYPRFLVRNKKGNAPRVSQKYGQHLHSGAGDHL